MGRDIREIEGGICAVPVVRAAGVHCGIKREKPDLAVVVSDRRATIAGVFTTNRVKAAHVLLDQRCLKQGWLKALVVNSGNANACTGRQGLKDAQAMAAMVAELIGCEPEEVFVASTGIIGRPLPMDKVVEGIRSSVQGLSPQGGHEAALAIMTTDTFPKEAAVTFTWQGKEIHVGGMAKGAGMISPHMATMLAFLATDLVVPRLILQRALRRSVAHSFNRITVDGDMSTNDTVLLLANGASGVKLDERALGLFQEALDRVTLALAKMIVRDGEGATKLVEIRVRGARTVRDAERAARAVANSPLVKTAFFGEDCNWGRLMAALGASGAHLQAERVDISLDGKEVVRGGRGLGEKRELAAQESMKRREFSITIDLHQGEGETVIWTTDLTHEYITINSSSRT
ncbi:MAG: bifunctional glutamate N-acetyltransferase/amino-acid acetyltransferase ArgJ [candidate division NC10 bacterium]|nr:bifunctional glutamate N-acetyltransferase/amino-acid acetyltransferase ArgJ [candidate division NC10 bacterium]